MKTVRLENAYVKAHILFWYNSDGMSKRPQKFNMERFFVALSDRTRLRLLNLMGGEEVCVCFFVEILKENQPKISRHLAYLRSVGIVGARRDGKWIHYRITMPEDTHAARLLKEVLAWLSEDREMQRDRSRLVNVCCAPNLPAELQGAPRPMSVCA